MEEVIGYVIVGSVVIGLYLGIKKLFKKKQVYVPMKMRLF